MGHRKRNKFVWNYRKWSPSPLGGCKSLDPSVVGSVGGAQTCRTGKLLPQPAPELTSDNGRRVVTSGGGGRMCPSGWQWRGQDNFIGFYYNLSLEYQLAISPPSRECFSFSNPLCEWRRVFVCLDCGRMRKIIVYPVITEHLIPEALWSFYPPPTHWVHPPQAIFTSAQSEWKLTIVTNQMT